jgi:serine/threonine protein kinase
MIGHKVEGYNIVDKVKEGSVGEIWLAGKDNQMYALKMLFEKHCENADKRRRFKREAKIARSLSHKNVITTYEFYQGPPRPFYVMEYFPSENLKRYILDQSSVLNGRRFTILRQTCEAIAYIHGQGVVHRDLKPENLLAAENGMVKLIDFSIAQTKWDRILGMFGQKMSGSPSYMAPEQIQNRAVDYRTDYYSLGVLAFELFAGRLPYTGPSMQAVFEKHLKERPPSVRQVDPKVPLEIDQIIQALMHKAPDKRPSTLSDIIYVLGRQEVRA